MTSAAKVDAQIQAVLKRLADLAQRAPDLAEPIAFYQEALLLLRATQASQGMRRPVYSLNLDRDAIQRKLEAGLPLLVAEDLPLDVDAARDLFLRLARLAEKTGLPGHGDARLRGSGGAAQSLRSLFSRGKSELTGQAGDGAAARSLAAGQIRRAIEQNALDLTTIWEALALGDWRRAELTAESLQLDADLLRVLGENSLKPALRAWARDLQKVADLDEWRRGQCPMCGSPPALAEIQGKEGARRLRCGLCGADWPYARLRCAFCANEDHKTLGYIIVEGEQEKYSLQTCDRCQGYLKTVVTHDPTPVDMLLVEDLATLHLDLIAVERGFQRVPVR